MTREDFLKALPDLAGKYQPALEVLGHINRVTLLMFIGPSGVGKSTLIERLDIKFVPSDTTREPRPGEREGVDFYFRKDYDQLVSDIKAGRFVQVAIGPTDFYATKASSYPDSGTAVMPIVADVIPVFRRLGFRKTTSAFIVPPSFEEWKQRMSTHPTTEEQKAKRLKEAKRSIEFALSDKKIHFILNDDVVLAAEQVKNLLNNQTDEERETKARRVTESLLAALPK